MQTAVYDTTGHPITVERIDEPRETGTEASETEMEPRPQSTGVSLVTIAVSIIALLLSFVGGLLTSVSSNSEWKGKMEQRIEQLERQRAEDKQIWEYIRAQNELMGKSLAKIEQRLDGAKGRP